jgi:hypothetical protein
MFRSEFRGRDYLTEFGVRCIFCSLGDTASKPFGPSVKECVDDPFNFTSNNNTGVYPKVSGLAEWSENSKCYSYLPQGAVVSLFYELI